MKKNLTMQLMPLWLLAFFFFASVPIKAQTNSEATPRVGIVKLIGCGTGNEANKAQIQVMHDGTGYSYNFGANASARSGNTAWVPAGTRTITVTKGSRVYSLPITVPDKVVPTFTPTITYNCNGKADVLLTNNQGTYNYTYTYGSKTDNSPYFKSLAVGQHTITVKYTPPVTTEKRVVFYDDFGTYNGETAKSSFSPYVNRNVFFDPLDGSGVQRRPVDNATRTDGIGTDSAYCIARRQDVLNAIPTVDLPNPIPTWLIPEDKDKEVNGKFLWYNVEHSVGDKFIVYQRKATVKTNAFFDFRASVYNPVYEHATNNPYIDMMPIMQLLVYANESDAAANVNPLYKSYELRVPKATKKDDWYTLDLSGYTGSNVELVFVIRMFNNTLGPVKALGNDVALDNILVTQPSDSCEQIISVPVNVVTDTKTFSTTVVYNCAASTGNITITPTVTTGYEYTYSLDGSSPQTSNTFNNAAVGVHTLTITYKNTGAKTLFKEDFGSGAPYSLPRSVVPEPFVYRPDGAGYPGDVLQEGDYRVANHDNLIWMPSWGWKPVKSHGDNSNTGRFLAFNYGSNANKIFYQQDIQVEPNKLVTLEYYALNIDAPSNLPNIRATFINKATNATIATYDSGALPGRTSATYSPNDWQKITHTFNPGSATTIQLRLTNLNNNIGSNDFAIDDILVTQAYDTCTTTLTATVAPKVTRAFAGVTKLIGCGTGANASKAEVTIANVQGGTGAYEYNFDGTWVATNTGWLAAGTHTVSVRAAGTGNSCAYDMSVTVPNPIAQPTIITEVFYGCDGRPTLKIGVQDPDPELTYMYSLDGGAYTTTYVYSNIATGTHQVRVQYEYSSVPSPFLLLREDFGVGPEGLSISQVDPNARMSSHYTALPIRQYCGTSNASVNGYYITKGTAVIANTCWGGYVGGPYPSNVPYDNTPSTTPNGRYMMIDLKSPGVVYEKDIYGVLPNSKTVMSVDFYNLILASMTGRQNPLLTLQVFDKKTSVKIAESQQIDVPQGSTWSKSTFSFVTPSNTTEITFKLYSHRNINAGNDLALDNIEIYQVPKACGQEVTTTVTIASLGKPSFSANVSNCSNTNSTITWVASPTTGYTYTYTLQGGTATSSNVFNGLATGNHTFTIDYAPTPNVITLLNEDFGVGTDTVKNQYVGKEWYFNNNTTAGYIAYNGRGEARNHTAGAILANDEYTIAANLVTLAGDWRNPVDKSGNANGRKLFVDGAAVAAKQDIYTRKVSVVPNYPLTFTSDFYNLVQAALVLPIYNTPANFAQVQLQLYENEAAYNASGSTPIYQNTIYSVTPAANTSDWRTQTLTLTAAQVGNRTEMYAVIRMHNVINAGHDLVVDNIRITQSIACQTTVTATVQNQVQNAFAGVTKLIGCGTGANANKAEVTIANVEGGSGTYEYSFDGITWTASNTGWLPVGTHTVSVRDGITKSCAYDMSVTVPAALAQPTIKTEVFYACDGKAILNIGVENPDPALKYLYSLDGAAYTTTYLYTNVASGTHSVSVQYEYANAPSPVMLLKETFGSGPDKCLDAGVTSLTCDVFRPGRLYVPNQGAYGIISGNSTFLWQGGSPLNCNSIWVPVQDHTSAGTDLQGLFFMADAKTISPNGDLFYKKKVKNVSPNSEIKYEFYILNLFNKDKEHHPSHGHASKPNIKVQLVANNGTVIASSEIGEVDNSDCNGGLSNWKLKEGTLNSGNNTEFTIEFRSNGSTASGGWGDDFCIDDIMVYQIPKACGQIVSATKTITPTGQDIPAFTVSKTYDCATGKGTLTVTPTATTGFTYTYTLGTTTYTSTTATFTGLDLEQTYTVSISYQAVSNTITLLNEDFGAGITPIKSPYVGKNLYFNENKLSAYIAYNANGQSRVHPVNTFLKEEEYTIANNMVKLSSDWVVPADHSGKTNGRILFINGISAVPTQEVYTRQVNVVPNLPLTFTTSFYNLIHNPAVLPPKTPRVNIALYESEAAYRANANNVITQTTILDIPSTGNKWETQTITLTAAQVANRTTMYAVVRMHDVLSGGHDLAIDDIVITQKLPACTTSVTATLTKGDVATPTLTLPANLSVICSAPTASTTISSWIASATATSTCGTATVTHNYTYPSNLCNVGGAVTVTFSTTDPFGNVVTATRVISFATMTLTVTPTTLSVPNGALGGTTSSVVPNITLGNTVSPSTNSVTITFSGLPTGVTSTTGGRLIVAPNTPAGSHTITYRVCETAGNNNCKTVTTTLVIGTGSLTVTPVTPLTVPNGISGGTTSSVLTGVRLNGNVVTNTNSVTISFSGLPTGVTSNTNGQLVIPAGTPAGTHTITYKVCEKLNPTNCQTVTSTLVIGTGSLTVTSTTLTHPNGTQGGTTTGTVLTGVKINGNPVNTASVTITWNSLPPNATGNASGTVTIAPNTPAGTYTISYTVCERLNGNSNCQSVTSQITIGGGSLTATPTNLTHPNGTQGGTTTGTVLTGVKINGNPVNTASVTITWNSLPPNATGNASGTVTIAPNTPAGTYTISYTVCERLNGNSNCQSVTSQITIGGGSLTATLTQLVVANGATGGTSVNNVLTGVKINGNPVNTNSVTITWNSLPPGFTGTNSGTVTVPANTPAGTYTVSYTVCERLNQNNNCKTVTSTIIVGNGNMIVVPTPITVPNGTIGGTSTPSVLTGVVLNGNSNPAPNTVSITWNSLPPRATGNNDGTVNVAPNTPAGTYTVSYTICEALNSGHCTTVTSSITIGGGVLTVTPVTTLTVANGAQGGTTTSSVLTGVSLNGQPANSQSVTITFSGLPAGVTSNTNGQLVVAPGTPATNTTIYYTVCETLNANNNCHTYSTTLVIGTPNLSVTPRTYAIPDATVGGTTSSVLETVTIDGHTPSSQSVTITFGNLPVGIQTTTSGGFRVPAGTPTGIHTVTYTVCEVLNPDHCVTSIATIAVGNVPVVTPNAFTYTGTATVTTPSILDDDTVGTQSATTGTGGNVVINITSTPTGTVVPSLDASNGRVTIPAGTPPGIYTITYDVCTTATPTACTPGAVVITIPNVPVITPDDMVYTDTTTTTAGNILTNDRVGTQSATAGNGGNVSITVTIPATPKAPGATVPTLNPNTGVVTVPAGTPSGTYTITYKICTTATPTSCDTGVVTITVSGTVTEAPDTNDVTAYTRINTPVTVGVTSSTTVTVSIPSQPANGTAVSNGDGTITYTPNNGFKGTDSFEYSLCNAAGCRTATISVRVTSELIIYNGVSIGGSDKNNHFHIEGIENYPNNTVRIYNRWGVKVFEMSGYNNTTKAFKGVSDARATLEASDNLPQGTYYYIIEYVDEHNKTQTETGWLYLKKN